MAERLLWNRAISHGGYGEFPTSQRVRHPLAAGVKPVVDSGADKLGKYRERNFTGYPQICIDSP